MSLKISAQIVDTEGKPLVGREAQLCHFNSEGGLKRIGAGKTEDEGKLQISAEFTATSYQPRLQLQLMRDGVFVRASEDPVSFSADVCDFGRVTFIPVVLKPPRFPVMEVDRMPDARAPSGDTEADRTEQIRALEQAHKLELDQALASRTAELTADKAAALAAQAQKQAQALATRTSELAADKAAALAAQAQQSAQQSAQALANRTNELNAERAAALAAQTQQHTLEMAARDAALAARDAKIHDLDEQLKASATAGPHETSVEDLAQTTASQIQRVQQSLRDDQSGLRLGKVSLSLKVMAGKTGGRVSLPQTADIEKVGAAALGSIDLAFIPDVAAQARRTSPTAPRVLGYTEALARRKLAERKLGVEVAFQLVTSPGEHGRVVLQRPPPGAPVTEGTVVLIAIGRQDEHDPRPT